MATYIYQGSTPILRFKPLGGISVTDASLGDPSVAVSQFETFISYTDTEVHVDSGTNSVWVQMSEEDTLRLVDGSPVQVQLIFANETTQQVVRFPIMELTVLATIQATALEEPPYDPEDDEPPDFPEDAEVDGDLVELADVEDYDLEDWDEDYDDTLEDDPEELLDIDEVEPWEPEDDEEE